MKKGFTLIETIVVVGIIGLLSILVLPIIINQISSKKEDIAEATKKLIFSATDLYLNNNVNTYPKTPSEKYCIDLQTLIDEEYLKSPIKDVANGKNVNTSRLVKTTVNEYGEYDSFELLSKNETCNGMIDNIPPVTSIVSVATDPINYGNVDCEVRSVTLELTSRDSGTGLALKPYSYDGGTTWVSDNTYTYTENGEYKVYTRDKKGNINKKFCNPNTVYSTGECICTNDECKFIISKINPEATACAPLDS